jgi:hypothetical protein
MSYQPSFFFLSCVVTKILSLFACLFLIQGSVLASDELKEDESGKVVKTAPWHQTSYFLSSLLKTAQQETLGASTSEMTATVSRQVKRFYDFYREYLEARKVLKKPEGDYKVFPYFRYGSTNKLWFTGFVKHKKTGCYLVSFQRERLKDVRVENVALNDLMDSDLQYASPGLKVKKKKAQKQDYGRKTKGWISKKNIKQDLKEQLDDYTDELMEKESFGQS